MQTSPQILIATAVALVPTISSADFTAHSAERDRRPGTLGETFARLHDEQTPLVCQHSRNVALAIKQDRAKPVPRTAA